MAKALAALLLPLTISASAFATTYYVDSQTGRDSNDGLTEVSAWKTVAKVNFFPFAPGDRILFRRDRVWHETLQPHCSGSPKRSILFGAYGVGSPPALTNSITITGWGPDTGGHRWAEIWTASSQAGNSGWTNNVLTEPRNYRLIIGGRFISHTGTVVRLKFKGHSLEDSAVNAISIGKRALSGFDVEGSPSRLKVDGGNGFTIPGGGSVFTEPVAFDFTPGTDYVVALQTPASERWHFRQLPAAGVAAFKRTAADDTMEPRAVGYHSAATFPALESIETRFPRAPMKHVYEAKCLTNPSYVLKDNRLLTPRSTIDDLKSDGDWYYDQTAKYLYVYFRTPIRPIDKLEVLGPLRQGIRIDSGYLAFEYLTVQRFTETAITSSGGTSLLFDNLDVSFNGSSGYNIENGSADVTLRSGAIHDNGWATTGDRNGVAIGGHGAGSKNILVSSVDVYGNANSNMEISVTDHGQNAANVTVEYTRIHDGHNHGFKIDGGSTAVVLHADMIYRNEYSGYYANDNRYGAPEVSIYNSVIWDNGWGGAASTAANLHIASNGTVLRNNIIGNGPGYELEVVGGYSVNSDYNLWSHEGNPDFVTLNGKICTLAALGPLAGIETHSQSGNPQFVDSTKADFRLLHNSPAIGAGVNLGSAHQYGLDPTPAQPNIADRKAIRRSWDLGPFVYAVDPLH